MGGEAHSEVAQCTVGERQRSAVYGDGDIFFGRTRGARAFRQHSFARVDAIKRILSTQSRSHDGETDHPAHPKNDQALCKLARTFPGRALVAVSAGDDAGHALPAVRVCASQYGPRPTTGLPHEVNGRLSPSGHWQPRCAGGSDGAAADGGGFCFRPAAWRSMNACCVPSPSATPPCDRAGSLREAEPARRARARRHPLRRLQGVSWRVRRLLGLLRAGRRWPCAPAAVRKQRPRRARLAAAVPV